ncbi:MAG: hypothetical protein CVU09_00130 [Bacteroidetes bacterium HGW-Bacteroidetes-4]|jgi:hypothetical protein|nr:MAG: hypothetical protein CVU09_00130 [Bacteroidetes bacterium HGW-Bacteroidetes-4]
MKAVCCDKLKKLYVDSRNDIDIKTDDFIVAIGKTKSNSVYHVVESKKKERVNGFRYYVKVLASDLITCMKRDSYQALIPIQWYSRN